MNYYGMATWSYLEAGFKFYIDEPNKYVVISPEVTTLDIKEDIYEALKEWSQIYNNIKYEFPIRGIGGDPTIGVEKAGDIYFMINGYRIVYNPSKVNVSGVLFSDDFDSAWLDRETLLPVYPARVSSLVNTVAPSLEGLDFPTALQNAQAVWSELLNAYNTLGSAGKTLGDLGSAPSAPTVSEIADGVWNKDLTGYDTLVDSAGYYLSETGHIEKAVFVNEDALVNGNGTAGNPYNNIDDAKNHAEDTGLQVLVTYSDITLTSHFKHFTIKGLAAPTVDTNGYNISGTEFSHCTLTGTYTLDNNKSIVAQDCALHDFQLTGYFQNCALTGTCSVVGGALVKDCSSNVAGLGTPILDMNTGLASSLSVRGYSGGLLVKNMDNVADVATIEMSQGRLFVDNTNTAGLISVRGLSFFEDTSAGTTVETSGLLDPSKSQLTTEEQTQLFKALTKQQFIALK
jgi:hypothetical protein